MRFRGVLAALFVLSLLAPGRAGATTVVERSLRDMTAEAPSIVHGTVLSSTSHWTENRSLIVTDVRIAVEDVLKGDDVSEVVVTQPGGTVGKLRVDAAGASEFRPGDEVVLFLNRDGGGRHHVVGLFQGRFDVAAGAQGGKTVRGVTPDHARVLQQASPGGGITVPKAPRNAPVPLEQFLDGIRDLVRALETEGGR